MGRQFTVRIKLSSVRVHGKLEKRENIEPQVVHALHGVIFFP